MPGSSSSNLVGMHGTVLYRRAFVLDEGGFDASLPAVEDYDLYLRLARKHRVAARDEVLADYRRHGSNMSNNLSFMLETALAVQDRHRAAAAGRRDWQDAFHRGRERWQEHYVGKQIDQLARARTRSRRDQGDRPHPARGAGGAAGDWSGGAWPPEAQGAGDRRRRLGFGDLRRTTPVSSVFGYDRGNPVDRHYIEAFLEANRADVRGRVLEIGDSAYTRQFGGDRVERSDVLNRYEGHPETTFVGDLCDGANLPSDAFDCIVLTQTLHLLFDMPKAVATLWRVLKPGGGAAGHGSLDQLDRSRRMGRRLVLVDQPQALRRLLSGPFPPAQHRGPVATATCCPPPPSSTVSRSTSSLRQSSTSHDPFCPVLVAGRAVKPLEQP